MTTILPRAAPNAPLAPITGTLRAMFGGSPPAGLAPDLVVPDAEAATSDRWVPAAALVDGTRLPNMLAAARRRWSAAPHVGAALAWKAYTYWLALPVVLGYASARRVPLMRPDDVLVHYEDQRPAVVIGLRGSIEVAVLPADPLALAPQVRVVADEAELLHTLRVSLLDNHLAPLAERIRASVNLGTRTLLGSVASGVAYGVVRAADHVPGPTAVTAATLLGALGVDDLVDLVPGPTGELTVQRRTCCLAFNLPEPKICSGCCIRAA